MAVITYLQTQKPNSILSSVLDRYHHQEWLHHDMKARFSRKKASVQNTSKTRPWPLFGILGSNFCLSKDRSLSVAPQAMNKHRKVSNSDPENSAFPFVRSCVTACARASIINITVRKVCNTVPKFVLIYFFWIFVAYLPKTVHWMQPHMSMNIKSSPDVMVFRKHWLMPSSIQVSVKSVPFVQNFILWFSGYLLKLPQKRCLTSFVSYTMAYAIPSNCMFHILS